MVFHCPRPAGIDGTGTTWCFSEWWQYNSRLNPHSRACHRPVAGVRCRWFCPQRKDSLGQHLVTRFRFAPAPSKQRPCESTAAQLSSRSVNCGAPPIAHSRSTRNGWFGKKCAQNALSKVTTGFAMRTHNMSHYIQLMRSPEPPDFVRRWSQTCESQRLGRMSPQF